MMAHTATGGQVPTIPERDLTASASLVQRIRAEYLEMPGLTLTVPQAARLWNLSAAHSQQLLSELVRREFLVQDARGSYRRRGCPRCS